MVQDNNLEEIMPLTGILSDIVEARTALEFLVEELKSTEAGFSDWPEEITDLNVQKQRLIALHQDLSASLLKAIELLNKFIDELT